jgi:Uma2 family endonuclease
MLYAPISVFLNEYNAPQPDLLFVSKKNEGIIHEKGIMGVPDLIVEIISPGSIIRDRIEKKEIYEQAGVREYWIVDPKYKSIEVYELTKEVYKLISSAEESGTIRSKVIKGLVINIEAVFEP